MSFRLNLQGILPQSKTKQPAIEELIKNMPNLNELEVAKQAKINSIIDGLKSIAIENFKFSNGNSVFTDSANLKNDVTEK